MTTKGLTVKQIWIGCALLSFVASSALGAGDYYQFLSRDTVQATEFTKKHPSWDGRGVVVAILDTGVDPSVPGLRKTTTGALKLIEARDFSGEGDVSLKKARIVTEKGQRLLRTDDGFVKGFESLKLAPAKGAYWLGFFSEEDLKNSKVKDVNNNGRVDESFAVLVFRPEGKEDAVYVVDLGGNGTVADDEIRRDYRDDTRWFRFSHPDPRKDQTPVAFTGTVRWDEKVFEMHFDDGGHGTHCAGISTGHGIQGRAGFDGIAPGANLMSLKIGNNSLAGGSTTPSSMRKAIEYASTWATEHNVPVVINLSYGIGSVWEGKADIDAALDKALAGNPLLVASVAAGNDGPGISTIGTPGASARAWTAGALLTPANAEALWGGRVERNRIFFFSSRGGELNKPDGLAPGVAWSTVPPFLKRNVMAGTSMATPQAAGVHALLISAATAEKVPWNSGTLKQALKASAVHIPGATSVDEGAGLIQVKDAFSVLAKHADKVDQRVLVGWDVKTAVPSQPGNMSSASYWRTGHHLPAYPDVVTFEISPALFSDVSDKTRTEFFEVLKFKSDVSWLTVSRGSAAVRANKPMKLEVRIKRAAIPKHGLNVGHIVATTRGAKIPAFKLPVVVVNPHRFDTHSTQTRRFEGKLVSGEIARLYVETPPGATSMSLNFRVPKGVFGGNYLLVHDPEGHRVSRAKAESATGRSYKKIFTGASFRPGVWELVAYGSFRNHAMSHWKLDVEFQGIHLPSELAYEVREGAGIRATASIRNGFSAPFVGKVSGSVVAKVRNREVSIEGSRKSLSFTIGADSVGADFDLHLTPGDYNKFTDIAVNILDASGQAMDRGGFGSLHSHVGFRGKPGIYKLVIDGGTTLDKKPSWKIRIREAHVLASRVALDVEAPGGDGVSLYPNIETELTFSTSEALSETPKGFVYGAELLFKESRTKKTWHRQDITLKRKP